MPPDQPEDDDSLLRRIARGEEPALAQLISRHGRGVAAVATRYLGSASEAEDVVQEAFFRVWQHAARFDPARAKASSWIYAIAVRLCIDRLRKLKLRRWIGLGGGLDVDFDSPDPGPGSETTVGDRQALAQTRSAIAALPDRQRLAILLSAVAGLDNARIAETLDITPGAVEQLLVRARRSLRGLGLR
ncbi:MAG: sigma-70 family RNA polymerase sigma factor [Tabrizicola sp.]|nr:sigma-70 family RNA polymerase sigma factor [Tabrizicola sp.]